MKVAFVLRSHGGCPRAVIFGDIHIDVVFIAALSADCCGNINGLSKNLRAVQRGQRAMLSRTQSMPTA